VAISIWQDTSNQHKEIGNQSQTIRLRPSPSFVVRAGSGPSESEIRNWNHLTVSDTGIGIPKEDLPNVFERFHRGSNVDDRHFEGLGLGIFICHGIVETHGGLIWVESPATTSSQLTPQLTPQLTDRHNGYHEGA